MNTQNMTEDAQRAVVARIAKLLRLSRGTDHAAEATAALAKAAQIAAEAGLSLDGIDADATDPRIVHEAGGVRRRSHSRIRCHGVLRRHFGVDVLGSSGRGAIYVGPGINIALARHIETYLVRQCAAGVVQSPSLRRLRGRNRAAATRAWEFGFYCAIDNTLTLHPIRNDNPLVAAAIERYIADTFALTTSPVASPSRKHAADAFAGYVRGSSTPCSRPVAGTVPGMMIAGGAV